ncbi:hypothetical protein [Peribacillus simplex]|uniref:hypothetical protein n=1 Tax=Peribacillus simplex TaxID=1478 RepID=UPI003D29EEDE
MFNKTLEIPPMKPVINSGLYKLSIPYFLGQSVPVNGDDEFKVYQFPVEAYIRTDKDLEKGVIARFVIYGDETRVVGDRYSSIATILRRSYFTALFIPDTPEKIKWIEYRSSKKNVRAEDEIFEIELTWNEKLQEYKFSDQKKLDSI